MSRASVLAVAALSACLVVLAAPSEVLAHPMEFGSLHLRETTSGRFAVRFEYSGSETAPRGATIAWPEGCEIEGTLARIDNASGESQRAVVRCSEAAREREVRLVDLAPGVEVAVHVAPLDGPPRDLVLDAGAPTFALRDAPPPHHETLARFLRLGLEHIASGLDHLAFVALLVVVSRRALAGPLRAAALARSLLVPLTAFTVGHALTLALATLGVLTLPSAPVEACIALSVLLLAAETARAERGAAADTLVFRHPGAIAGAFGLLHGLGFAGALADAGLGRDALAVPLLGFHLGIELGQLGFVALVVAVLAAAERRAWATRARLATAYVTGIAAMAWTLERLAP